MTTHLADTAALAARLDEPPGFDAGPIYYAWTAEQSPGAHDRMPLRGTPKGGKPLHDLTVMLVGLGAVGGPLLNGLAQLGLRRVIGCDPDRYGPDSWRTQPAARDDAGRPKTLVQGAAAWRTNPACEVLMIHGFAQDVPLHVWAQADAILLAGDNLEVLTAAADKALLLGKPLLEACVDPDTWTAIIRRYDRMADGPCPACSLSDAEWSRRRSRAGCSLDAPRPTGEIRTRTLPFVCRAAAQLAVAEFVKAAAGEPDLLEGGELAWCLKTHRVWRTAYRHKTECRLRHEPARVVELPESPAELTLGELLTRLQLDPVQVQLSGERPFVRVVRCSSIRCPHATPVLRFAQSGQQLGECACGGSLVAGPVGSASVVPQADLRARLGVPLADWGLAPRDALHLSFGEDRWLVFLGGSDWDSWLAANAVQPREVAPHA